jgi:hypothetical protein
MESGLSESHEASVFVKIDAGLPLPIGVAHNGEVIFGSGWGALPSAS